MPVEATLPAPPAGVSDASSQPLDPMSADLLSWKPAMNLPCQLSFGLPIPRFTLGDLLNLRVGTVLDTARPEGTDVVVMLNDHIIGWAEFESSGQQIAFRFTELAG